MGKLLTIKEFASIAGVTPQSIYKRIKKVDNPIQLYLIEKNGQVMLKYEALNELYGVDIEQPSLNIEQPVQPKQEIKELKGDVQEETASNKVIDILREQIIVLKNENETKDKQIEELNKRLEESQRMLDQQQKLSMADKQQILMLEKRNDNKKGLFGKILMLFSGDKATEE